MSRNVSTPNNQIWFRAGILAATLLALWLRLYMVEHTRLWPDELYVSRQHLSQPFWHSVQSYQLNSHLTYMLAGWFMAQLGWDTFLLRWPAVVAAVLTVPLLYVLGTRFFNRRVGAVSAVILSFAFVHVDLSWRIRGYTLVLLLVMLAVYCLQRGFDTARYRWWIGAVLAFGLAIHTHIFVVLALPYIFLFVAVRIWFWKNGPFPGRLLTQRAVVAAAVLTLILAAIPLLIFFSQTTEATLPELLDDRWNTEFPPFQLNDPLPVLNSYLELNNYLSPLEIDEWFALLFGGIVVLGVVTALHQPRFRWPALLLLGVMVLPILSMTTLATILGPWFFAFRRFFVYVLMPYLLFAALGSWGVADWCAHLIGDRARLLTISLMIAVLFVTTVDRISAQTFRRPSQVARYLHNHHTNADLILCAPQEPTRIFGGSRHFCPVMLHFFPNLAQYTFLFDDVTQYRTLNTFLRPGQNCTSHYQHLPVSQIRMICSPVKAASNRRPPGAWVVLWRDNLTTNGLEIIPTPAYPSVKIGATEIIYISPQASLADTLIEAAKVAVNKADTPQRLYLNAISLANLYAAAGNLEQATLVLDTVEAQTSLTIRNFDVPPMQYRVEANFADQVMLLGYDLPTRRVGPGQDLPITLYWQALQPITQPYLEFNHLLDAHQQVHGGYDRLPREEYNPIFWKPGEVVVDAYTVPVNSTAPPGVYHLNLGIYLPQGERAVPIQLVQNGQPIDTNSVTIGPLKVGGPPPGVILSPQTVAPDQPLSLNLGDPPVILLRGYSLTQQAGAAQLKLYWESLTQTPVDWSVFVHLRNKAGEIVAQKDGPAGGGRYPTSLWDPGEILADELTILLPAELPAGEYSLMVGLYNLADGTRLTVPDSGPNEIFLTTWVRSDS